MAEPKPHAVDRIAQIEAKLDKVLSDLHTIKNAFPEDEFGNVDAIGHRRYHDEMIEAAKAQTKFWQDLRNELLRKGLFWAIIIGLGLMGSGLAVKTGIVWGGPK
jgi:hypothetical protein